MVPTDANLSWRATPAGISWSNRVLLLALAGIFFLTLYPFRFDHAESSRFLFPFSLNGWGKGGSVLDGILNVLLFVPFGFGLAEKLREWDKSKYTAILVAYVCGAFLSYFVEFLQIYIPYRDSGWDDVITNSAGSAVGAWMFVSFGAGIIAWFSTRERKLEASLTLPKIGVLVALYIGFWCVVVRPLQRQTKLVNWTPDSFLAVGDSASLRPRPGWKGRVSRIDLWNHAISAGEARKLTSSGTAAPQSLAAYRVSGTAPFRDLRQFLPDLDWASQAPSSPWPDGAIFDGRSWLISGRPVPALVSSIENTGQFSLRVICEPSASSFDGRIFSISSPTGAANMQLSQFGSSLAFWFRNPLSMSRMRMTWVERHVFAPNETRDILLSFDGTALSLFVNGRDYGHFYELGPGIALAHYVRRVKATELPGYEYIFYAIVFFPGGCLIGFAWRKSYVRRMLRLYFVAAGFLLPSLAFEWVLAGAGNRAISLQNICFAVLIAIAGSFWINADRHYSLTLQSEHERVSVG